MPACRGYRTTLWRLRSASPFPLGLKRKPTSTCPADRADILCRPATRGRERRAAEGASASVHAWTRRASPESSPRRQPCACCSACRSLSTTCVPLRVDVLVVLHDLSWGLMMKVSRLASFIPNRFLRTPVVSFAVCVLESARMGKGSPCSAANFVRSATSSTLMPGTAAPSLLEREDVVPEIARAEWCSPESCPWVEIQHQPLPAVVRETVPLALPGPAA